MAHVSDLSVITIVRNRERHLMRLIAGLADSDTLPRELIVVDMSDEAVTLPALDCPVRRVDFKTSDLALAAARNVGARTASGERLLFLDVDCIPRRNLVATIDRALIDDDALICPEVRYLGPGVSHLSDELALEQASRQHPVRAFPPKGHRVEDNAGLFWSLTFGIRRARFEALEGFDEGYKGYGAEDTDFGFRAKAAGLRLLFLGGTGSFHQHHGVISPPLQHLADIVKNANRFHARWGIWPMEGWLADFAKLGVAAYRDGVWRQLREPTRAEMQAARQPPSVYF